MKSQKEEGNSYFKQEKFKEAAQCYNEYVKLNNKDNSKAYSNMALSYFKLTQYEDCIKACQMAVQLQPEFDKPFYRMFEAYRQLKDYYGMFISASKFCKVSNEEKQVQTLQKQLVKIKEDLSFNLCKSLKRTPQDEIINQIVNLSGQNKQIQTGKKEAQISIASKWQRIEQLIKKNKRQGLNQAIRFLNTQCKCEEQRQKYKRILLNIKNTLSLDNDVINSAINRKKDDSCEEDIKVQELIKLNDNAGGFSLSTDVTQSLEHSATLSLPTGQQSKQNFNQTQKSQGQQTSQASWRDFITESQAQELLQSHINKKLSKAQDPFGVFFECLCSIIRSTELDRFQKQAVLAICPDKLKKFSMLMKSYSTRQKQQLAKLFTEFNLHSVMEKYHLKKLSTIK